MLEKTRQELDLHPEEQPSALDNIPLDVLGLSRKAYNCLRRAGLRTVAEVAALTDERLLSIRNLGVTTLAEIRGKLTIYLDNHPLPEQHQPPEPSPVTRVYLSKNTPIDVLRLSIQSYNALWRGGIITIGQLAQMSPEQILNIQTVDEKSLVEIEGKLRAYLDEYPLLLPEPPAPAGPEPPTPLVDPVLLAHAAQVERYLTWLVEQDEDTWSASPVPVPRNASIEVLGLSTRPHNALTRGGIITIGQLAQMSSEQILYVRNVGEKSLAEIEEKLKAYLAEHPLSSESTLSVKPKPSLPLAGPGLLARVAQIPLDNISLERLALPARWRDQLHRQGIKSVGELARQTADAFGQHSLIGKQLKRYLTWLVEQDEATWADEVAGRGISPLHRLVLAETTLEGLTEKGLSSLKRREKQVIRWRYGLDGDPLTLGEIGERLDVTRERVRQIQIRALRILSRPQSRAAIRPLATLLVYLLGQAGGLMNEAQIVDTLQRELIIGDVDPVGAVRLVFEVDDDFKWLRKAQAWGLTSCPLTQVPDINQRLSKVLEKAYAPISFDKIITRFKVTRYYLNHRDELDDTFIAASLRTHPQIEVDGDGMCGLKKWATRKLDEVVLALRQIGHPVHYSIIAEQANALLPQDQQTSARNIHAILDRYPDIFINVGRGKYWLQSHLREETSTQSQADFGDLFGARLERWQKDWDRRQGNVELDTQAEVDTIRRIGLDFFNN
jgi:DNA-directed RNA polymerase alpha subunit